MGIWIKPSNMSGHVSIGCTKNNKENVKGLNSKHFSNRDVANLNMSVTWVDVKECISLTKKRTVVNYKCTRF